MAITSVNGAIVIFVGRVSVLPPDVMITSTYDIRAISATSVPPYIMVVTSYFTILFGVVCSISPVIVVISTNFTVSISPMASWIVMKRSFFLVSKDYH
jgi:hypothetical protein